MIALIVPHSLLAVRWLKGTLYSCTGMWLGVLASWCHGARCTLVGVGGSAGALHSLVVLPGDISCSL